jgi:hypothetical protein
METSRAAEVIVSPQGWADSAFHQLSALQQNAQCVHDWSVHTLTVL